MPDYRFYGFDAARGTSGEWIQAKSDDEATVFARAKKLGVECELWQGKRLVAKVPAYNRLDKVLIDATPKIARSCGIFGRRA